MAPFRVASPSWAMGLCQYNRRRLPDAALDHGIATHPTIRVAGSILLTNPFYQLPELAKCRSSQAGAAAAKIDHIASLS